MLAKKGAQLNEIKAHHLWKEVIATNVAKDQWPAYIVSFLKKGRNFHLPWLCLLLANEAENEIRE
jgi:hypothetical protein